MGPGNAEALTQLYDTLQRYAGWLDRARTSVMVRVEVQALRAVIDTDTDPSPLLNALETNIARLPSGELWTMLRVAAGPLRRAFT